MNSKEIVSIISKPDIKEALDYLVYRQDAHIVAEIHNYDEGLDMINLDVYSTHFCKKHLDVLFHHSPLRCADEIVYCPTHQKMKVSIEFLNLKS